MKGAAAKPTASKAGGSVVAKNAPTQPTASSGLGDALAELTESDFNRHSPFEAVYAPPKPQTSNHELIRRVAEQDGRKNKSSKGAASGQPVVLVLYAVHNLLQSLTFFGAVAGLAFASHIILEQEEQIPMLGAGLTAAMIIFGLMGGVTLTTAIGLFSKRLWGYALATGAYCFFCVIHVSTVIASLGNRNATIGGVIGLLITVFLTTYFFRSGCRKFYRLKGWVLPLSAAGVGALLGVIFVGVLTVLGAH